MYKLTYRHRGEKRTNMTTKQESVLIKKLEASINLLKRCKDLECEIEQYEIIIKEQKQLNELINNLIPCEA